MRVATTWTKSKYDFKSVYNNRYRGVRKTTTRISNLAASSRTIVVVQAEKKRATVACLDFCRGHRRRSRRAPTCACACASWWASTASPGSTSSSRGARPNRTRPGCRRLRRRRHRRLRRCSFAGDRLCHHYHHRRVCNPIAGNYRLHRKAFIGDKTNNGREEEKKNHQQQT